MEVYWPGNFLRFFMDQDEVEVNNCGGSRGGPPPPLPPAFYIKLRSEGPEKNFYPPPPPPPLSQGLDGRSGSATEQTRKLKKERGHDPAISSSSPSRVEELESINIRSLRSSLQENQMEVKLANGLNVSR